MEAIIWRRFDSDTTPRGLGYPPSYHVQKPYTSDYDMVWAEEVAVTIPDTHHIAPDQYGELRLWDASGRYEEIIDSLGHPSIYPLDGKYQRLDGEVPA